MIRASHLSHFYQVLEEATRRVGGLRRMSECTGHHAWPTRGVYFFFEPGETRESSGIGPRVVRVGTHALKTGSRTKLWNRLSQHRGAKSSGRGNHRGSIFRLLVGLALIERDDLDCATWGEGSSAPADVRQYERHLELTVSTHIGRMEVGWIDIPDEAGPGSMRGYIERNSIALLSNAKKEPLDPATDAWLGASCPRPLVERSGLWNQNHVTEDYDPQFLNRFAGLLPASTP